MAVKWSKDLRIYAGAFDLSTASTQVSVALVVASLDPTVFLDTAERATADVRKDEVTWAGWYEDSATGYRALSDALIGSRELVSVLLGSAAGARVYSGTGFIKADKNPARLGELVRAELTVVPDAAATAMVHFGTIFADQTGQHNSTGVNMGFTSTLTHTVHVHIFKLTAGTLQINLNDSADGTTWAGVAGSAVSTTTGGLTFNMTSGTIRQWVRTQGTQLGVGTYSYFLAYKH